MNKKSVFLLSVAVTSLVTSAQAAVTLSGTALLNAPSLSVGQDYVLLVDTSSAGFGSLTSLGAGLSISDNNTYGSNFEYIGGGSVTLLGGTFTTVTLNATGVNLTGGVNTGDSFGILVFNSSTGSTSAGDTFEIWTTTNWVMPSDGATVSAPSDFDQLNTASSFSGSVVPEPGMFAFIFGAMGLAIAGFRRRCN